MLTNWVAITLIQTPLGLVFWLPVIISLAIVVGGLILNAFIAGKQFERKADKLDVVSQTEYRKDMERVSNEIDECNEDINEVKRKVRIQELKYYAIDKKLDILIIGVNHIKENCPNCKSK
jgi:hypothetical protein